MRRNGNLMMVLFQLCLATGIPELASMEDSTNRFVAYNICSLLVARMLGDGQVGRGGKQLFQGQD